MSADLLPQLIYYLFICRNADSKFGLNGNLESPIRYADLDVMTDQRIGWDSKDLRRSLTHTKG